MGFKAGQHCLSVIHDHPTQLGLVDALIHRLGGRFKVQHLLVFVELALSSE